MGITELIGFIVYALVNAFTPGPGNLLALNTTARVGWKKGIRLLIGVFLGYYSVQLACAFIVYGIDQYLNSFMTIVTYVGAAYILWLAHHIYKSKPTFDEDDDTPSFWTGYLLQLINVKIYLFGITSLTGFVAPYYNGLSAFVTATMSIATIGTIATFTWAILGANFQHLYKKHYKPINVVLALVLVESAVSILFK